MSGASDRLREPYIAVLKDYLAGDGEIALQRAYELGRQAMLEGLGVLEVADAYHLALMAVLSSATTPGEMLDRMQQANAVYAESLSPFEMFQRGFEEISALRRLNEELAVHAAEFGRLQATSGGASTQVEALQTAFDGLAVRMQQLTVEFTRASEDLRAASAERQRVEESLRESEESFRLLMEGVVDYAIFRLDSAGRIVSWNAGAEHIYGYRLEEILGRQDVCTYTGEDVQNGVPERERTIAEEEGRVECEGWRVRKDGTSFWANAIVTALRAEDGRLRGFSKVTRDITERRQAENAIRTLNAELEQRVLERTAQLEAANKELEAFSYSVSHDLRAPLRSIDGFSKALLEDYGDRLDAEGQAFLQRVRAASQRMAQLIDDLLELSRVTRSEMRREPTDLSALARTITTVLQQAEPQRQVMCVIAEGLTANGDARLLRIVLENLFGNAWKFTGRQANACIEFGVTPCADGQAYFVRDNGAGFDMMYADKLFGAFQRLHGAAEYPGTGIGLATVQRIIRRHGGQVWAESMLGKGATFYFTL